MQPVKITALKKWIERGRGGKYLVMRPKEPLSPAALKKMKAVGKRHQGKSYDLLFEWSDSKMYCSELAWKVYKEGAGITLVAPRPFSAYNFDDPKVQAHVKDRWKGKQNPKEPVVAPSDLAASEKLKVVHPFGKD